MKNLKKLTRNELKTVSGGKWNPIGNCGNACSQGGNFCEQFGLSCNIYVIESQETGQITSYCWKCT